MDTYEEPVPNETCMKLKEILLFVYICGWWKHICCCLPWCKKTNKNNNAKNGMIQKSESQRELIVNEQNGGKIRKDSNSVSRYRSRSRSESGVLLDKDGKKIPSFSFPDIIGDPEGFVVFSRHVIRYLQCTLNVFTMCLQ